MRCWLVGVLLLIVTAAAMAKAPREGVNWRMETLRRVYVPPAGFYCYAPGVIQEGDVRHVFACRNAAANVVRDHIYYLRASASGTLLAPPVVALGPETGTDHAWDGFHVCDPSPVAGRFAWGGTTYRYALFFLGNDVNA